jgi:hypothetical protein
MSDGTMGVSGRADPVAAPRWTFACTRCDWIGSDPATTWLTGYCDCPHCGNSCTEDEPSFEPRAGCLDGSARGFDPVWPPNTSSDVGGWK